MTIILVNSTKYLPHATSKLFKSYNSSASLSKDNLYRYQLLQPFPILFLTSNKGLSIFFMTKKVVIPHMAHSSLVYSERSYLIKEKCPFNPKTAFLPLHIPEFRVSP